MKKVIQLFSECKIVKFCSWTTEFPFPEYTVYPCKKLNLNVQILYLGMEGTELMNLKNIKTDSKLK